MIKNNYGFLNFKTIILFIFLSIFTYLGVNFYTSNTFPISKTDQALKPEKGIEFNETKNKVKISDFKNKYSIEIDTSKTFIFSDKNTKMEFTNVEKNISFQKNDDEGTFNFGFTPNQRIILSEGFENFYINSINRNFNPNEYWKEYLNNKNLDFKFRETLINGFKAYTTVNEPGIGLNVTTIVKVNPTHYVIFGYIPYMADTSEFDNPNYSIKNSKISVIQNYFDILNSIKKLE